MRGTPEDLEKVRLFDYYLTKKGIYNRPIRVFDVRRQGGAFFNGKNKGDFPRAYFFIEFYLKSIIIDMLELMTGPMQSSGLFA